MKGRLSLPGASELFRTTGDGPSDVGQQDQPPGPDEQRVLAPARSAVERAPSQREPVPVPVPQRASRRRRVSPEGGRHPTGRERHDEKITVYVSAEELMDLERARLSLRGEHGLVVDRGRIVREALAFVLTDLQAHGEDSTLVRRLTGA